MRALRIDVEHFTLRLLQDCLAQATARYWTKRANDFEQARPKPGEHHGNATPIELTARDEQLAGIAAACRARAVIALGDLAPEAADALEEAG